MKLSWALAGAMAIAGKAHADDAHCGNFGSLPPGHPIVGQLRWDVAGAFEILVNGPRHDGELGFGVTKLVDIAFQSLDLGVHATLGGAFQSPRAYAETSELQARFYPVKLRQAFGIDECGQGTKTRRWSETTDAAGYIILRAGYGHVHGDVTSHDAFLLTPGLGYDWNLGEGRSSSLFVQLAWRFDVAGNSATVTLSGPLLEAGLRF